jgi:hypothetical protein
MGAVFAGPSLRWKLVFTGIVLLSTLLLLALFTLAHAAYKGHKDAANVLPEILHVAESNTFEQSELVCLLEPSELFSHGIFVSFYAIAEEGLEVLVGIGVVTNVQKDGKIQVALTDIVEGYKQEVDKLKRNDAVALKNTRVKNTVPATYLRAMLRGGPR